MESWKYDYFAQCLRRTFHKPHENFVFTSLIHDPRLINLRPVPLHHVRLSDGTSALIDNYYPQIRLAVEVDERHHDGNKVADELRQQMVEAALGCTFYRLKLSLHEHPEAAKRKPLPCQIEALKDFMLALMAEANKMGTWQDWRPPQDIDDLREVLTTTLFIKLTGRIPPEQMLARQTGTWNIAEANRDRISKVIVMHEGWVINAFKDIRWEKRGFKWGYTGTQIDDDPLLGARIDNWTWRQRITYSFDMYKRPRPQMRQIGQGGAAN